MAIKVQITETTVKGSEVNIDSDGYLTAIRRYVVKFVANGEQTNGTYNGQPFSLAACFAVDTTNPARRIPKYGDLFSETAIVGYETPVVKQVKCSPHESNDSDPWQYIVTVEYGRLNTSTGGVTTTDDEPEIPENQRERYPWEQPADIDSNFTSGSEFVPETLMIDEGKVLTPLQVVQEQANPQGHTFVGTPTSARNSAGDHYVDPPTVTGTEGKISISFAIFDMESDWNIPNFLQRFHNHINDDAIVIGEGAFGVGGLEKGTVKLIGYSCSPKQYMETATWYKKGDHPFGWFSKTGRPLVNNSKIDKKVTRYFNYYEVKIDLEYQATGYNIYLLDVGYREKNGNNGLRTIQNLPGEDVTQPVKLDGQGKALPQDRQEEAFFLKYRYYPYAQFSEFISKIPWKGTVIDFNGYAGTSNTAL